MTKEGTLILLVVIFSMASSSCAAHYYKPPDVYWRGEGVYAETLTPEEMREAEVKGRLKHMGHFFSSAFGCFGYTESLVESNIIIPAIQRGLHENFGNAASHVKVIPPFEAHVRSLLFAAFGCASWTVEGEAFWIKPS